MNTADGPIDCDVHPMVRGPTDFDPFLSARWREHRRTIGNRSRARAAAKDRLQIDLTALEKA